MHACGGALGAFDPDGALLVPLLPCGRWAGMICWGSGTCGWAAARRRLAHVWPGRLNRHVLARRGAPAPHNLRTVVPLDPACNAGFCGGLVKDVEW